MSEAKKAGTAEVGFGNNALGTRVYATGHNHGKIGIETHGLGVKAGISLGYQLQNDISNTHVSTAAGAGINVESSIVPGKVNLERGRAMSYKVLVLVLDMVLELVLMEG